MNVHNLMENIVIETVNDIFEDKKKEGFDMAECLQCRLDVACYVLNRIGRIPEVGEAIKTKKCTIIVKEKDGNRIKSFVLKTEQK